MSRTFRRKGCTSSGYTDYKWFTSDFVRLDFGKGICIPYAKDSKEFKRGKARFHADSGTTSFKEPGPGWFRNMFNTRPSRVAIRAEINKWLRNEDYEVVAESKPHLSYWT